jgi:hypothetical protein
VQLGEKETEALKKRSGFCSSLVIIFGVSTFVVLAGSAAVLYMFPAMTYTRLPPSEQPNMIQNGGFEDGMASWTTGHNGTLILEVSTEHVHNGRYALKIATSMQDTAFVYQFVNFSSSSYVFEFWMYRTSEDSEGYIQLVQEHPWVDGADWAPIASDFSASSKGSSVTAWHTINGWQPPQTRLELSYIMSPNIWHKVRFVADDASETQNLYVDEALITTITSNSGSTFNPEAVIIGDVSTMTFYGTFYFDDFSLTRNNLLG